MKKTMKSFIAVPLIALLSAVNRADIAAAAEDEGSIPKLRGPTTTRRGPGPGPHRPSAGQIHLGQVPKEPEAEEDPCACIVDLEGNYDCDFECGGTANSCVNGHCVCHSGDSCDEPEFEMD